MLNDKQFKSSIIQLILAIGIILFLFFTGIITTVTDASTEDTTLESLETIFQKAASSYQTSVQTEQAALEARKADEQTLCQSWKALKTHKEKQGLPTNDSYNGCF